MMAHLAFWLPVYVVMVSAVTGCLIFVIGEQRVVLRTALNLLAAVAKVLLVGLMSWLIVQGAVPEFSFQLLPGLEFKLRADSLSLLFAALSAVLWLVTTVYAVAYLERSTDRARFFGFFSLCVTATMGIAMAGNLLTFFIFYELLTLTTWPLVIHNGKRASFIGARTYLLHTLGASVFLLVGIIWLYQLTGGQDFIAGGYLSDLALDQTLSLQIVFWLLVIGFGVKAALFPLHAWLPRAMVAPAPVSALLHAVAVVKAGAFGLVRLVEDIYGFELVQSLGLDLPLLLLAGFTIVYGSTLALFQTDIKKRLAYSTVSQVSYITLGVAIGGPIAAIGGMVHLVHQGLMKITLFFCAGIFANLLGVKSIEQMDGMGRRLPWTSLSFSIAALGMIGLPPVAGFVSKWHLGAGAVAVDRDWVILILLASTLLNAAYFLPLLKRIWLNEPPAEWPNEVRVSRLEAGGLVGPVLVATGLSLAAGLFAGYALSPLSWVTNIVTEYFP